MHSKCFESLLNLAKKLPQFFLDLEELGRSGVDFYAGNLHKWAFVPRGRTAVLWVRPERKERIEPTVISHSNGDFNMMFCEQVSEGISNVHVQYRCPRLL